MKNKINMLFKTEAGQKIYKDAELAIKDFDMQKCIMSGLLVGVSGGADSVMLLCVLNEYRRLHGYFPILAVHINHLIRGEEAFRDEAFSRDFCMQLGVDFQVERIDVPLEAKKLGKGIEETARDARYSAFRAIMQGRNDISFVAVAHNATDNFETVLLNMMRGAGTRGVSGIAPVRDDIIRPLIYSSKQDIVSALKDADIAYVNDSTNDSIDYNRNYVRHEIIPKFLHFSKEPERVITKLSNNLRADFEYLESLASDFYDKNASLNAIHLDKLRELHPAILTRVINKMCVNVSGISCEKTHIDKIISLIKSNNSNFSVSLPGEVSFILESDKCFVGKVDKKKPVDFAFKLKIGVNSFPNVDGIIIISDEPIDKSFSNVYKISIQRAIDFDIINGELSVRSKRDGDAYVYGGMNHKLKKLFNDKSVPPSMRSSIPLICDDAGILWVPGFGVRDSETQNKGSKKLYIALAYENDIERSTDVRLYKGTDWMDSRFSG